jgi:hypothetical protein
MPPQQGQTLLDLGGEIGDLGAHKAILVNINKSDFRLITRIFFVPAAPA